MTQILKPKFFDKPTIQVAQELLGKYLARSFDFATAFVQTMAVRQDKHIENQTISLKITEVEAYDGPHDLACHASKGKTQRNEVMFGPPGHFYVYLIYGMYWMLNIVTGPPDYPAAILIRGIENYSGPGKLTKALKIDKQFDKKIAHPQTNLWVENRNKSILKKDIIKTSRIGVDYAGPIWSKKLYRFVLKK